MGFFDKAIPKNVDVKQSQNVVNDPIMYKDENPDIYILLERQYSKDYIKKYVQLLKSETPELRVCVIGVLNIQPKTIKGSITKFYTENKINISSYIPPFSKVVADRRTILALNESDIIDVEGFYDIVFNESYYYNPKYKLYVFPVEPLGYWFNKDYSLKDNWHRFFHLRQVKTAYQKKLGKKRHKRIKEVTLDNPNQFLKDYYNYDGLMALDIETSGMNPWNPNSYILEITVSMDGITGYHLLFDKVDVSLLNGFLKDKKLIMHNGKYDSKHLILNGVDRYSIYIYHDTWNGSHVVNEMQRSSLKADAWVHTDLGGYDNDLDKYTEKYPTCKGDYGKIPQSIRIPYAIKDAIVTYQIYEAQVKKIDWIDKDFPLQDSTWTLKEYFYQIVMPTVNMFLDVELEGMLIDWDKLKELSEELDRNIEEAKKEVWKAFDVEPDIVDLDSGPELGTFLEMWGLPKIDRSKEKPNKNMVSRLQKYFPNVKIDTSKGVYLTGEAPLTKWRKMGFVEQVDALLKYRELKTLMNTFVGRESEGNGYFQYRQVDNKIHPTFGVMLTDSHRNWSKGPNVQQIPKQGDRAKWYRQIFNLPSEDYYFVEQDMSGLQLRIGCIMSDDKEMRNAFINEDGDLHSTTASNVFTNLSIKEFKERLHNGDKELKKLRFKAKGANFSLLFNSVAYAFAKNSIEPVWSLDEAKEYVRDKGLQKKVENFKDLLLNESKDESEDFAYYWAVANDIRKKFFQTYKGLEKWTKQVPVDAQKQGYVRSPFGAIRRLPELLYVGKDDIGGHIKNLKNISLNSPVQNYEVVLMMKTMFNLNSYIKEHGLKSKVIDNVHDSIVMYVHKDEMEEVFNKSKEFAEEDIPENKGVPMLMEFDIADYYGKGQVWGFGEEVATQEKLREFLQKN